MKFSNFITYGRFSPFTLWNRYTHGQLSKINWKPIGSRMQPGGDGDCVSMILLGGKIPSWYSLPCHIETREYICKRLAEKAWLPVSNHVVPSGASYSKCNLQEVYAVNKCYLLGQGTKFWPRNNTAIEMSVKVYIVQLFQCLNAVTSMTYQIQTSNANTTDINEQLCFFITSNSLFSGNTKKYIEERKCIPTNTSKIFHVFGGGSRKSECEFNQVLCDDGTCISQDHFCFDYISCSSERCACRSGAHFVYDQYYCRHLCVLQNCSCPPHYFQCGSGGCIQFTFICDGKTDCLDASDEMCEYLTRITSQQNVLKHKSQRVLYLFGRRNYCLGHQCLSGECIPLTYVNDLFPDCSGGQAEDEKLFLRMFYHGEHFDCLDRSQHPCVAGLPVCFSLAKLCVFDLDEEENILWCRNGAHVSDCTDINCTNSYKCPDSYCIPFHRVCNGIPDCIHGEDEQMCDDYICKGLLRCKGSRICVHPAQICDGENHCPRSDDEGFCDWKSCGLNCTCVGYSMICIGIFNETLPTLPSDYMKHMSVSRSIIPKPHFQNICYQKELSYLNLSYDKIDDICSSFYLDCEVYKSIVVFDLSHNEIEKLGSSCFRKLISLKIMSLAHNNLQLIHGDAFSGLSIEYLNMNYMSAIRLTSFNRYTENALSHIPEVMFTDPLFCCSLSHAKICLKRLRVFGSCPRILPYLQLGCVVIVAGCFSIFMNVVGLIINSKLFKDSLYGETISYLMLINVVLGTYLPLIGSVDIYYGQRVISSHARWSESILCRFMDVASSTSLMISLCLNGLLMYMTIGAVTRVKFVILKTHLAFRVLLITGIATIFNLIQSLVDVTRHDQIEGSVNLCNVIGASKVISFPQHLSVSIICLMMVSLFMYVLYGTIKVINYTNTTTKEVLKYSEGDRTRDNARKRKVCKRMVELILAMSFITLPYSLLRILSIWYDDIYHMQISYVIVMFSTIILQTFHTPLIYIYQPMLNKNCKGWDGINFWQKEMNICLVKQEHITMAIKCV